MACLNEPLLSAYLDGALQPGELDVVVGHLESCPACLQVFHEIKAVRALLRTMPPLDPPEQLIAAVSIGGWADAPAPTAVHHPGDRLSAFLDGELATGETESVGAHLAECGACRIELQELDAARTAVRALPRLDRPDLSLAVRRTDAEERSHRSRTAAYVAAGATAAAAVVVALALMGGSDAPAVDIDRLVVHHNARQSVEAGFSVIPAIAAEPNR